MIVIIDYGLGNIASVANALRKLEISFEISDTQNSIRRAKALILPGVGAASQGMKNLKEKNLDKIIIESVQNGKPLLGICLGMQLLLSFSEEGNVDCLDLIEGKVKKFQIKGKIPQIGWNRVECQISNIKYPMSNKLFNGIYNNSYFYYVNSYYCEPDDESIIAGLTNYDTKFCSVFVQNNIVGAQFHPEKSGDVGLQMLKNFWEAIC